jgi:hypothetical protein
MKKKIQILLPILALRILGGAIFLSVRSVQMETEITRLRLVDGTSVPTTELQAFIEKMYMSL